MLRRSAKQFGWLSLLAGILLLVCAPRASAGLYEIVTDDSGWAVKLPQEAASREVAVGRDWSRFAALVLEVQLGSKPAEPVRLLAYLQNKDGWWYQTAETQEVPSDSVATVRLDLTPTSTDWVPKGHFRPWDALVTTHVVKLGLKAFADKDYTGKILVKDVRLIPASPALSGDTLQVFDCNMSPKKVSHGELLEITFRLTRGFFNPFDPDEIDIRAHISPPSKKEIVVPGFLYQDYVERREGSKVRLIPVGRAVWKVRFLPREAGTHGCRLSIGPGDRLSVDLGAFECLPEQKSADSAPEDGGSDLEFGDFRVDREVARGASPYVLRDAQWDTSKGLLVRSKIKGWRAPLQWTPRWGAYQGLGKYNLEVAWQFDQLLRRASEAGLALPFVLNSNEPLHNRQKYNWPDNPLNAQNRGPLTGPSEYFSNSEARRYFKQYVRYVTSRWASFRAVAAWELWNDVPANQAEDWHREMAEFLPSQFLADKLVVSYHPQSKEPAVRVADPGFERRWYRWRKSLVLSPSTTLTPVNEPVSRGSRSLQVTADYPGEAALIITNASEDWSEYAGLSFDVYVPAEGLREMRAMVYLRDGDLWWYETLLEPILRAGDWNKLIVDLTGDRTEWRPQGHAKEFDRYALQRIKEVGIRVFGHKPYDGPIYVDNFELWNNEVQEGPIRDKVLDLHANAKKIPRYGRFELTFRLTHTYSNPFDPASADLVASFVGPSGKATKIPAFFYQDYERRLVEGREALFPKGRSCWKVRFAPTEVGKYACTLKGNHLAGSPEVRFECVASNSKGFVRASKKDPRYLEFANGSFFYPIGYNLRSPSDGRKPYPFDFALPEGKGTFIFDEYFDKLKENGMTWARVWMCSWWCGLEWIKEWPGYHGVGRYNLENAWRLDYLVEQAEKKGIYIQLCTTNHGQYSIGIDHEWEHNPFNRANGGFIRTAAEMYTDEKAWQKYKDRMRYTVARWGSSANLMAWALLSEIEFTEEYWKQGKHDELGHARVPTVADWHSRAASYVKEIDPWDHLVTTHFSHPWRGSEVWERKELDFVQSNAYSDFPQLGSEGNVVVAVDRYYNRCMSKFKRPVLLAEYGGHWYRNSAQRLDAELHCGSWSILTTPIAGNTGFWWWIHVHFKDKYEHYRGLARFVAGEDFRDPKLRPRKCDVVSPGSQLLARCMHNGSRGYAWVYHTLMPKTVDFHSKVAGATLSIAGLQKGNYEIEFWHTRTGQILSKAQAQSNGQTIPIRLPEVEGDVALKVRRK